MKYWTGMLILLTVLLASTYAFADAAPPPKYFWESQCDTYHGFKLEDCVSQCENLVINEMACLYYPELNQYFIYSVYEVKPTDIRTITSQCQYFEQFGKKFPTSLKLLNAVVKSMKTHQDCNEQPERVEGYCEKCNNTELSTYCFFAGYKERCKQHCRETQMCIDNYINRNVFW